MPALESVEQPCPEHKYYDPKSTPANPRWYRVDVKLVRKFERIITLAKLKAHAEQLGDLALLRQGNRLSVIPVTAEQWEFILELKSSTEQKVSIRSV